MFSAAALLADGTVDQAPSVEWSSSNSAVASITAAGDVTSVGLGQAVILARLAGVESEPALVTVVNDPQQLVRVDIEPDSVTVTQGASVQLSVVLSNLAGDVLSSPTSFAVADPDVAMVTDAGLLRAIGPGETTVSATADGISSLPTIVRVFGQAYTGRFSPRSGTTYEVKGEAVLQEDSSGLTTLQFGDDFFTSSGPGLKVYLSTVDGVSSTSIDLGDLKQTAGAQSYPVGSVDASRYRFVIIHCVPFNVTFGSAVLR